MPDHLAPDHDLGPLLERIGRRQRALRGRQKTSDRAVSLAAGLRPDYLRSLRRQFARGEQHRCTLKVLEVLAKALQTTPEWLLTGSGEEERFRAIVQNLRDAWMRQELCIRWSVRQEGDTYIVEERLQMGERSFGPVSSKGAARRIIESRQDQLTNWFRVDRTAAPSSQ